jgi:hypothetical protein
VSQDTLLSEAVAKVFGKPFYSVGEGEFRECVYPLQVLRFPTADVLLTMGNALGDSCHGCGARLTAYVLKREAGDLRLVARFVDFAEVGTFGSPGAISPVQIGPDDGIAIEHGGTFQGYTSSILDLYAFHKARAVRVTQGERIPLSANNGGAVTDPKRAIEVDASWTIDPTTHTRLSVTYGIKTWGRTSRASAEWMLRGGRFVMTKGTVPPEVLTAGGQ